MFNNTKYSDSMKANGNSLLSITTACIAQVNLWVFCLNRKKKNVFFSAVIDVTDNKVEKFYFEKV